MDAETLGASLILGAALLDRLLGDPIWMIHPVVVMGWWIRILRLSIESWSGDHPGKLRIGGGLITVVVVLGSGFTGWCIERMLWLPAPWHWLSMPLLITALASALAARSLADSVNAVMQALPPNSHDTLDVARQKLSWIVGRDVQTLDQAGILRAAAETASENAVDGVFAPLFWMGIGALLWSVAPEGPGPLALAWSFKASSTLDSMLGYRTGRLQWLGTAGARLDDLLTWLPCRLVMLSLPLVSRPWNQWPRLVRAAERDGSSDPSPNAGRSEAIYAHCIGICLGGDNRYGDRIVHKPVLAAGSPQASPSDVKDVLSATTRLETIWIAGLILSLLKLA